MEILDQASKEQAADRGQHGVTEIAVQWRHGSRLDAAAEPVAHDEIMAIAELLQKGHQLGKVIAIVGVTHDDVLAASSADAAQRP